MQEWLYVPILGVPGQSGFPAETIASEQPPAIGLINANEIDVESWAEILQPVVRLAGCFGTRLAPACDVASHNSRRDG
jgi:hypothetical protein